MYKLMSGLIGVLITIMIAINGVLSGSIGNSWSLIIIHVIGVLSMLIILTIKRVKIELDRSIPIYLYSAGAIGILTVLFNNISFNHIGASLTLSLGLLGQSLASIAVDHYGLFGMKITKFRKEKILGFLIISLGIIIMAIY